MFNVRYNLAPIEGTLGRFFSRSKLHNASIMGARAVVNNTADWINRRSIDRHKTAERLKVNPTGILEFVHGDGQGVSRGGGKIYYRRKADGLASIFISGIPFIQKAFRDLNIRAKRAKFLTIPMHHDSARTSARQMEQKGYSTFFKRTSKGNLGLYGKRETWTKKRPVLLYVLKPAVRIPRDHNLLPKAHLMDAWAEKAIRKELFTDGRRN